ncbi:MAG: glutathione S-transferase family protein [Rhodospirillaceae bacterium]|nr:glutathione S-transferase family protein [Rhodospirillaceae bacterium]MDD9917131.1 glutathione S-transferase family protein [Rhodospirillaceae bacterium]MDD9924475.1 glutathione S-transferase family protein [Rhodospirillaceae bacterium]
MPYRLYNRVGSGGFVVEAALAMAKTDYELEELDSRPSTPLPESFRQHNPWRQVPTLILPDGSTMSETAAILIHLAACHPDRGLGPAPGTTEHAQFLRWIVFANVNVYEAILRRPYTERYTTDPNGLEAVREASTLRQGEALSVLEAAVEPGPFLLGANMSVLDVYVAMLLTWYNGDTAFPRLDTLKAGVKADATVGPIWRRHFGNR